jgi:hypothetical protein
VDGAYEVYFSPEAKPGERGGEGMRIVGLEPMRRFAFTWGAPPRIPVRAQRTIVILEFEKKDAGRTLVRFTHLGWGEGASWDEAYEYLDRAWNEVVLPPFRYAMEVRAVNWERHPSCRPWHPCLRSPSLDLDLFLFLLLLSLVTLSALQSRALSRRQSPAPTMV